jgi:hypothetical protein
MGIQARQSKSLTIDEVKRYRTELLAHVARTIPPSDADIIAALAASLDRPAFRTPFRGESSLPRFREAAWRITVEFWLQSKGFIKLIFDSLWACFELVHKDIDRLHLVFLDFSQNVVPKI